MSTGIQRRSGRISELEERKAQQAKGQNKAIGKARLEGLDLVSNSSHEELPGNSACTISENILPERCKLRALLDRLQRRDRRNLFANPVNPDEAKGYYDIIKEPMDFGTISSKLDGGKYRTLAEFEHDVTLVHNNAMLFNASTTTYYVQGLYIRDLAQKLFTLLKTNPENFEQEVSGTGKRARRPETDVPADGEGQHTRHDGKDEPEPYKSWDSILNNESIMSLLYKKPEPILSEMGSKPEEVEYKEVLMRLVNDLV